MRNLIFIGGIYHPFEEAAHALSDVLEEVGIESTITSDFDAAMKVLSRKGADLFTVYALRWGMTQHEKYEPFREKWAFEMTAARRENLSSFVRDGGGLLGMHTASICFDDWPGWKDVLGGRWVWGESSHPPLGTVEVRSAVPNHTLTEGLEDFSIDDEVYRGIDMRSDVTPLMEARAEQDSDWFTIAWAHEYGGGRVVCDMLGHDAQAIVDLQHRRFLQRAALWSLRKLNQESAA